MCASVALGDTRQLCKCQHRGTALVPRRTGRLLCAHVHEPLRCPTERQPQWLWTLQGDAASGALSGPLWPPDLAPEPSHIFLPSVAHGAAQSLQSYERSAWSAYVQCTACAGPEESSGMLHEAERRCFVSMRVLGGMQFSSRGCLTATCTGGLPGCLPLTLLRHPGCAL